MELRYCVSIDQKIIAVALFGPSRFLIFTAAFFLILLMILPLFFWWPLPHFLAITAGTAASCFPSAFSTSPLYLK